jgi:hypothetical protein
MSTWWMPARTQGLQGQCDVRFSKCRKGRGSRGRKTEFEPGTLTSAKWDWSNSSPPVRRPAAPSMYRPPDPPGSAAAVERSTTKDFESAGSA